MRLRKFIPEIIVLVYAVLFLVTKNPSNEWDRVIVSDGKGYYAYLPALFIYHDTDFGFIDQYETDYYPASRQLYKDYRFDTGNGIVNKYFPGPALLWLPFFAAGHASAALLGYATDGYSLPYQWAIAIAAFFYFWLALLVLRKILRFYTKNENAIAWSLVATALATNLIYYTVNAGCQVHVYDFFLINAFVYSVLAACKWGKTSYFASAAFMLGMIIISRPQNGLIVFALPFICGSRESLKLFITKVFTKIRFLIPSALSLMIPLLVPVSWWYIKTGHFLVYSYGKESYDLLNPHLFPFLFSFEKGWLLYTPIAVFAALGFVFLFKKSKWQFFSLAGFLFFLVYFMSSWWVWTYTSYVSQRVMIDFYVFIALLLVFIFEWIGKSRKRLIVPFILTGFIALNLLQHFQQLIWIYPAGPVTAKVYFSNFFSFSRGTTYMIPGDEITGEQTYSTDFEKEEPLFQTTRFSFSDAAYSGRKALILDTLSKSKLIFARGMSDYKEVQPLILKIGAWYNPNSTDSTLTINVSVGNSKKKYSTTPHNLMPGLNSGQWKYAEMAVYLPYIRSVSDSLFISFKNLSKGNVQIDNLHVEFLKMRGPYHHDWILPAEDPVDTAILYRNDLEKPLVVPWGNAGTISSQQSYSGAKSSCIRLSAPYSVGFEKEFNFTKESDGYLRVCSRIMGDSLSQVLLVFDFSSKGKQVLYKTYPVILKGNSTSWNISEIFREFPVALLKADEIKIYYWYQKGQNSVYIDDIQVDMVKYKPAVIPWRKPFTGINNTETVQTVCCDFEQICQPESGYRSEVSDAFSGKYVNVINSIYPFSFSHFVPLNALRNNKGGSVFITAKVNSDHHISEAALVADFRQKGKSVSYHPDYLHGQTIKGKWNQVDFKVNIPEGITANDSVLVYFYLPKNDEEMMVDDFCVSIKKKK